MTVVAAWWTEGGAFMASDSSFSYGGHGAMKVVGPKIIETPDALCGFAGARVLFEWWWWALATDHAGVAAASDLRRATAAFRAWAKSEGHGQVIDGLWTLDLVAVFALRAGLWAITPDGAVMPIAEPYHAIGSGRDQAMGALYTLHALGMQPTDGLLSMVVGASIAHAVGIDGPPRTAALRERA